MRLMTSTGGQSRKRRIRHLSILLVIVAALFVVVAGWIMLMPPEPDRLCAFMRDASFHCPTLIADPVTLRPGGIVKEVPDKSDKEFTRFDLPHAYLDDESCLIPGAKLDAWSLRDERSFELPTIRYKFDALAKLHGEFTLPKVQGLDVDVDAAASRTTEVAITFGPARTRLLDENLLLNRIERCEISPRCVERIRENGYQILNRILEVDGISYSFVDSRGVKIPLGVLLDSKIIRSATANFDIRQRDIES
jgi:hypothetical protein